MAKLIFETDDGEQNEVNLDTVKSKSLSAGDIIVAKYEIGDIGEAQRPMANQALTQLKDILERVTPDDVRIVVVATRNGKEDIKLQVLRKDSKQAKKYEEA